MMKAGPYALSIVGTRWQRRLVSVVLVLAGSLPCFVPPADAKNDYEIINTGIKGSGCWYDDSHFIVVKGQQPAPGQEFEVEGLYYLDPSQPKDLKRIDLSPIDSSLQRHIRDVTCQDETILFNVMGSHRKTSRLYGVTIGQQPELIADLRWAKPSSVNLRGRYVVGNKLTVNKGVWEEQLDCDVRFVKPGFRVLCWPRDTIGQWLTPQSVISEHLWRESILVKRSDGKRERVRNPTPPLKLADGTELKQGYLLRDLDGRDVQVIPTKQAPFQILAVSFKTAPLGKYLYGVCYKAGDHGDQFYTQGGRICRYLLDESNRDWEEIVNVQTSPKDPFSLHELDVNAQGDVVMIERGHRLVASLWKYSAQSKQVDKLLQVRFPGEVGGPRVSPSGKWVSAIQNGQLVFIEQKGAKP